ncbi:MAG: tetraacyldisaccharide 4'-kinase [Phycisphaeraceae bacterium]|nr:tetraacyldisaccharide 4'-kinase [Phycisphaeraceae bacterium]
MTHGPVPWLPAPLASLASRIYLWELHRRNAILDRGKGVTTLDIPVISIGNLSVGGTGKTPLVEHIARTLASSGAHPAIAMRGYRASHGLSDEAREYALALQDVPTLVNPDRISAIRAELQRRARHNLPTLTCIILDDGFQHRKLARNLDIVLIDATRSPFNDHPLPRGWLREPVQSLRRAHAVIITRADLAPDAASAIQNHLSTIAPGIPIATVAYEWSSLDIAHNAESRSEPLSWLKGKRLLPCAAIGNPNAFLQQVEAHADSPLLQSLFIRDHDPYAPHTIDSLISIARDAHADAIITTRKDWTKLSRVSPSRWPCPIARPVLQVRWLSGADTLQELITKAITP